MSTIELVGLPRSNFLRAIRILCEEKAVAYTITPTRPRTPELLALHPFGKMPAMRHDGFELCESSAIARYIDAAFDGPKLFPAEAKAAARTEQWVSLVNTHIDRTLMRTYLFAYVFPKTPDRSPDRPVIDACVDDVRAQLMLIDRTVAGGCLVDDRFTYADANLIPILDYLERLPESGEAIRAAAHLPGYMARLRARPGVAIALETAPG